jgi:hypothetical protein
MGSLRHHVCIPVRLANDDPLALLFAVSSLMPNHPDSIEIKIPSLNSPNSGSIALL